MFAYGVYQFGAFLAQRFSQPTARKAAAAVGRLSCFFQRRNRRHLYRNLEIAFGEELGPRELRQLRARIYANFGVFVCDFLRLPKLSQANARGIFTESSFESARRLGEGGRNGKPAISLTGHVGHWELGAAIVGLQGYPLLILADTHPSPQVTRFFNARREEKGPKVIPVTSFLRCFRELRGNGLVAIVGDRPTTGQGIETTFFGRPALVPDGHATLARRLGASLYPTFCMLQPDGRYEFTVQDPIVPRITDDEQADVRDTVDRCLRVIEDCVRRHPEQWYVFRPIWDHKKGVRRDRLALREERRRAMIERREARREASEIRRTADEERHGGRLRRQR